MLGTTFPAQSAKLIDVEIQHKNPFECLYNPVAELGQQKIDTKNISLSLMKSYLPLNLAMCHTLKSSI